MPRVYMHVSVFGCGCMHGTRGHTADQAPITVRETPWLPLRRCVECRADMNCGPKEHCQYGFRPDAFTCVKGKKCTEWNDCGPQEFCDFQTGRCRAWGLMAEAAGQGGSAEF